VGTLLIDRALPKIQSNLISSLAQLFRIDNAIDLIVKTYKENFEMIIAFGHSAFITSQSMFVLGNMVVLKRYLACRTFRKCQPHSSESCLYIRTYI